MAVDISVVIPAYCRPAQTIRAIDGLLSQSGIDIRVIVVDDASPESLSEAREKVEESGHLWIRRDENGGPGAARNEGAAAVGSKWIAFLDSDDEWLPEKMRRQMKWHRENPTCRISQVREEWIRNGKPVKKPQKWEQRGGDLFSESIERCSVGPSCVMIRRDLWDESGGFDESFRVCEDYELWLRITRTEEVGLVPGPAMVRKHGGHADQLSTSTPALDRYRIAALAKLRRGGQLSEKQRGLVERGIREKAKFLAKGAEKRDFHERAEYYRALGNGDLTLLDERPDPVESASWAE